MGVTGVRPLSRFGEHDRGHGTRQKIQKPSQGQVPDSV